MLEGADVNKGNNHKNTALHLAAQNGWTEIAKLLLKHRQIEIDAADFHANTALHLAAQNGQMGVSIDPQGSVQWMVIIFTHSDHRSPFLLFQNLAKNKNNFLGENSDRYFRDCGSGRVDHR